MPKVRGITLKQKRFADKYMETGNGAQAALAAYNTTDQDTAKSIACENLTKPYIQDYIKEKLKIEDLNVSFVVENLMLDTKSDNPIVRTKSLELLGKYLKLFSDKSDPNQVLDKVKSIGWED